MITVEAKPSTTEEFDWAHCVSVDAARIASGLSDYVRGNRQTVGVHGQTELWYCVLRGDAHRERPTCFFLSDGASGRARLNKAKTENLELGRMVRRELGRHALDCAEVAVTAVHGVIYLHGRVRPLRGHEAIFEQSVTNFLKTVRQRHGVREVIPEWTAIF